MTRLFLAAIVSAVACVSEVPAVRGEDFADLPTPPAAIVPELTTIDPDPDPVLDQGTSPPARRRFVPRRQHRSTADFSGLNVGVNVGWSTHESTWNDNDNWVDNFAFDFNTSNPSRTTDGRNYGGLVGYNWQSGGALLGIQADVNRANLESVTIAAPNAAPATTLALKDTLNSFTTVRGRAGVVVDHLLLYGTAGVAFADVEHIWQIVDPVIPAQELFKADSSRLGSVVGLGAEVALSDHWSLRYECLFINFRDEHTTGFSPRGAQWVNFNSQDSMVVNNLNLVFRFW